MPILDSEYHIYVTNWNGVIVTVGVGIVVTVAVVIS